MPIVRRRSLFVAYLFWVLGLVGLDQELLGHEVEKRSHAKRDDPRVQRD